jgi:ferrous iron transport protein A
MKKTILTQLKQNTKAKIIEISGGACLQRRLMSMGVYPGREIKKLSHFALRGPIAIKVGRSILALGFGMARKITVETQ